MQKGSTLFLRLALIGLGALVAFLSGMLMWSIYVNWNPEFPNMTYLRWPVLMALLAATSAFFVASTQAWKLLNNVDKAKPFSKSSITALRNIKYSAFVVGLSLLAEMPLVYWAAQEDDAPGLMLFGLVFAGVPIVVGVFAGVLQQLIQKAVDLKSEVDLTV